MIYTVTLNPSVDYIMCANSVAFGKTNRSVKESYYFGGKGINVSLALQNLGIESTALGFIAGFTGAALEQALQEKGIVTDFVCLQNGFTRINLKLKTDLETEINAKGPSVSEQEWEALLQKLENLKDGDTLILAGSVPGSLPRDCYELILSCVRGKNILFVVDTTGQMLLSTLPYRPFLIKPNQQELEDLAGSTLPNEEAILTAAKKLQQLGARNVLISRGGEGALLLSETGEVQKLAAAKGIVCNTVGAGDSMVAGFLYGWQNMKDYAYALRCGVAAGGATAFSEDLLTQSEFQAVLQSL